MSRVGVFSFYGDCLILVEMFNAVDVRMVSCDIVYDYDGVLCRIRSMRGHLCMCRHLWLVGHVGWWEVVRCGRTRVDIV